MTNNLKPDPNDRRYEVQSRTNVHFLVFHLTLADAIVSFITMPMETIWRVVIEVQSSKKNHHIHKKRIKYKKHFSGMRGIWRARD